MWENLDWTAVGTGIILTIALMLQSVKSYLTGKVSGVPTPAASVEVAGALIDTKRIDTLIDAIGQNTYHITDLKRSLEALRALAESERDMKERYRQALVRNTETAVAVAEVADRLSREMRDLRNETSELRDEMLKAGVRKTST